MKNKPFCFTIPDESYAIVISDSSVSRISDPLKKLLDASGMDSDTSMEAFTQQEDGSLPILLSDGIWMSSCISTENQRLILLKHPSRMELEEWLEMNQSGKPCMLTEGSGRILALTESAHKLFTGYKLDSLGDFLDQVSMTAFLSASSRCLSGDPVRDFSVLTRKGQKSRKSQIITLNKIGILDNLILVSFSSPSMALNSLEKDSTKFIQKIFSIVPLPALRIDDGGNIVAVNSRISDLVAKSGGGDLVSSNFLDLIVDEDKERIATLHRNRYDSLFAPFHFRTSISLADGIVRPFEMTSLLMPDREEYMVFLLPAQDSQQPGDQGMGSQRIKRITDVLLEGKKDEDYSRAILELLRVSTGARGAAYFSKSRRITVGESVLPPGDLSPGRDGSIIWGEDSFGHNVTIPTRHKQDSSFLRITGIPSKKTDPLARLILSIAPILAEYLRSRQSLDGIISILNSISMFMTVIQGRERSIRVILGEISAILEADYVVIHTVSSKEPVLKQLVSLGTSTEPSSLRIEIPSIASWAYTHTEICYVPDTAVDQRFSSIFPSSRSEMSVPLICDGRTMGTLTVGCTRRDAFGYPLGSFLQNLGAALSLWLFREGRGLKEKSGSSSKKEGESIPGLDELLMSLSYHMRAPITTLRGNTDLLLTEKLGEVSQEQKESLKAINTALVNLVEHVDKMLNFMKIELSNDKLETSWARPSDIVSSMLPPLVEKGRSNDVTVTAELPSEPFTASFDRSRLEQVIGSLVNNAIQYNRPGGTVKVEVKEDGSNHWVLEVFNTGRGILPDDLPNIFERFYRGSMESDSNGLGIGLTIVKNFVQQMGGNVNVRSRQGTGTWFTVRFPIS